MQSSFQEYCQDHQQITRKTNGVEKCMKHCNDLRKHHSYFRVLNFQDLFARYPVVSDRKIWREYYIMEKSVTEIQFWRKFANVAGNNI